MRPAPTLLQLAVCLTSMSPMVAAWPEWLPDVEALVAHNPSPPIAQETGYLEIRAGKTDAKQTNLNTAKADTTKTAASSKETGKQKDNKHSKDKTKKKGSSETHTSFNAEDPPGGVSVLTPATTLEPTPLYKINDYITFGWNYTSLQGTPTAVDVLVSCSFNTQTWTLTSNMTFATKGSFVWDTKNEGGVQATPLLTELFTLIIKDSDTQVSDIPDPGYLEPYEGLKFGLYTGQPYTPLSEWTCVGCNGAIPGVDRTALGFAFTMSVITVASFTWFVAGLGLW